MSFYNEILPFSEYIHSIRKLETYLSFDLKFPGKWGLPKSAMEQIQIVPYDVGIENLKGLSFVSKFEERDIEITISTILKIIKINKEKEIKEKLFKETVDRLKTTFEKTDLDKLQTLYFDFEAEYDENTLEIDETTGEDNKMVSERAD